MVQNIDITSTRLYDLETLTAAEKAALLASAVRGRAQYEAGEGIPGEEVSAWLKSWGTENELPPPSRKSRQA